MIDYVVEHILEIVAIVSAFVIFFMQIRKKALTYKVLTNSSLILISDNVKDNIQIRYKGKIVPNVRLVEIRIKNSGSLPIKPEDYIEPLGIYFTNSKILSNEIIDIHSLGIHVETELSDQSKIIFSKTLLNPNDSFDAKVILGEAGTDFSIGGRIVGVNKFHTSSNLVPLIKPSTLVRPAVIYILMTVLFSLTDKLTLLESAGIVGLAFLVIGLIYVLGYLTAALEVWLEKSQ
jgi:hypothetical protein